MSDEHVQEWLSAYLDSELAAEDRTEVEAHLAACGECQRELDELRALDGWVRTLAPPEPPSEGAELATRVRARLQHEKAVAPARTGRWLAVAATLAAVAVVPWLVVQRSPAARETPAAAVEPSPPDGSSLSVDERGRSESDAPAAKPPRDAAGPQAGKVEGKLRARDTASGPAAAPSSMARSDERRELEVQARELRPIPPPPPPPAAPAAAAAEAVTPEEKADGGAAKRTYSFNAGSPVPNERAANGAGAADSFTADPGRAASEDDEVAALSKRTVANAGEAESLREAWAAFLVRFPRSPHAARARFGQVEAGAALYRFSGRAEDLAALRRAVETYNRTATPAEAKAAQALLNAVNER